MKKIILLFSVILFSAMSRIAAQTPVVDTREHNQRARIAGGISSGELTRRETLHAAHDQRAVHRTENSVKADGVVTRQERARLYHKQNQASRELRRNKHDAQQRRGA